MSRREKRNNEVKDNKSSITFIVTTVIVIAIIAFILSYIIYGSKLEKQSNIKNIEKVATTQNNLLNTISNTQSSEVSSSIGKNVNELINETNQTTTIDEENKKADVLENKTVNTVNKTKSTVNEAKEEEKDNTNVKQEKKEDPNFIKPVEGDVIKEYASENLIYSNTLDEWTTHLGIDYKAEKTSIVKAGAEGTVKSIKNDPRYGLTVVLEHNNGFTSMYSNLLTAEFITVGEKVTQGQTIATVGNTATFEVADETHLHFEILQNGVNVDPNIYIK